MKILPYIEPEYTRQCQHCQDHTEYAAGFFPLPFEFIHAECGKVFKLITSKHLAQHGLDADAYREKWGIKCGTPLVCKCLQRTRRKKMNNMKLWEKRAMARAMKGGDGEL